MYVCSELEMNISNFICYPIATTYSDIFTFFCLGTVEYCSPEVLNGNCYNGRELEMWTLGILLYVMIFNENPFYGVDETLQCQLKPPFEISPLCLELIKALLEKDPQKRMKLEQLASHQWVTQSVEIENYRFRDVVHCSKYFIFDLIRFDLNISERVLEKE